MTSDKKDSIMDLIGAILLYLYLGFNITLVIIALFGGGGAESEANIKIFNLSAILGIVGISLIFLLKFGQFLVQQFNLKEKYGWIGTILHDPETSPIPTEKKGLRWIRNPFLLAIFFIIISSFFGMIQIYQNTFWTGLPQRVPQQIHQSADIFLSIFPADLEIFLIVSIAGLLIVLFTWLGKQNKIPIELSYTLIYLIIPIIYAIIWSIYHLFRYGANAPNLTFIFLFGLISGVLLVLFRSLIPILILKILNNAYAHFNGLIQANETILLWTIIANVALIVITFGIITAISTFTKKKVEV